jgi:hypothetical protein
MEDWLEAAPGQQDAGPPQKPPTDLIYGRLNFFLSLSGSGAAFTFSKPG